MGSKFDKIKRLLSEENTPLPPELEWEQMEDGIMQKMEALESGKSQSQRNRMIFRTGLILLLLLIPFICVQIIRDPDSGPDPQEVQDHAALDLSEFPQQIGAQEDDTRNAPSPEGQVGILSLAEESISAEDKARGGLDQEWQASHSLLDDKDRRGKGLDENARISDGTNNGFQHVETRIPKTMKRETMEALMPNEKSAPRADSTTRPSSAALSENVERRDQIRSITHTSTELLPRRRSMLETSPVSILLPVLLPALPKASPDSRPSAKPAGRLALLSGISTWRMGFGSNNPERDQFEQTRTSFHSQFQYLHTLRNNFTLLVGLQYHQLESRLDWSTALDDYTVTLKDTILQIQTNTLTGQQNEVRGDIEIQVEAERTVRHHNTTRLFQIPIAVGKTWTFKNWQADMLIGGALNVHTENHGRTIYQSDLIDYDSVSTDFMQNRWKIHGLLIARLTYKVNDHLGITSGFQFQKSLMNWSLEENVRMYPGILSWEFGVNYSL